MDSPLTFSRDSVTLFKQTLSLLLAVLIVVDMRWSLPHRSRLFTVLGVAGGLLWWNLFQFHYSSRFHYWDYYHYYIGAKYIDEIGYSNLYRCSLLAQHEAGQLTVTSDMLMRELRDNSYVPVEGIIQQPELCKASFTEARWREFSADTLWFKSRVGDLWERIRFDHGFNATPAWLIAGHALVAWTSPSETLFHLLSSIDDILIVLMWGFIWSTFGAVSTSVALVYWGTNAIAEYAWTGGTLLRHDWFVSLGVGLALMKRGRELGAGILLGYASWLRIFPALVPLFILAHSFVRAGAGTLRQALIGNRTLLAGLLSISILVVPLSQVANSRPAIWMEFVANLEKHSATRTGNSIGLGTIISNVTACRYGTARDAQGQCALGEKVNENPAEQAGHSIYRIIQLLIVGLFLFISRRTERWKVAVLSVSLLPFLTNASSYYLEMLAFLGLLYGGTRSVGLLLCALAFLSQYIATHVSPPNKVHLVTTVFVLQFVLCVIYLVCVPGKKTASSSGEPA